MRNDKLTGPGGLATSPDSVQLPPGPQKVHVLQSFPPPPAPTGWNSKHSAQQPALSLTLGILVSG